MTYFYCRLILSHLEIPELYYLLFGLTLGQPMRNVGADRVVSVERVWGAAWGAAAPSRQSSAAVAARITLCPEAVVILLGAVRALIHADQGSLPDWLSDHPVTIIQVSFIKEQSSPPSPRASRYAPRPWSSCTPTGAHCLSDHPLTILQVCFIEVPFKLLSEIHLRLE